MLSHVSVPAHLKGAYLEPVQLCNLCRLALVPEGEELKCDVVGRAWALESLGGHEHRGAAYKLLAADRGTAGQARAKSVCMPGPGHEAEAGSKSPPFLNTF